MFERPIRILLKRSYCLMPRRPSKTSIDRTSTGRTWSRSLLCWCFRPKRLVAAAGLALGLMLWPQLSDRLPDLDHQPEYLVAIDEITITAPPDWIPQDLVHDVLDRADIEEPLSLLDASLNERVALAFYTHPWIADVRRVTKSFPPEIHVDVDYRRPVAIVHYDARYYPVDRTGYLLPGNDFRMADVDRYPLIEGIASSPQSGQGRPWDDPAVEGAAELAGVLLEESDDGRSLWTLLELQAIEVSTARDAPGTRDMPDGPDDPQYVLRTARGSRVLWGRAPTTRHPGELSVVKKVQRLVEYREDHVSLDDALVPYVIDIRGWNSIERMSLSEFERRRF